MKFFRVYWLLGAVLLVAGCTAAPDTQVQGHTPEPLVTELQEHTTESHASELPIETLQLIDEVRGSTAGLRDLGAAEEAGYGKFLDCFRHGDNLGMGQHYVNSDLVGDDDLDPSQPEGLVYEPREDGSMILVAFEYIVFEDKWDPKDQGRKPPELFGQTFSLKTNIPDTPPLYALHMWLWAHNPEGLFADYNPLVSCPPGASSIDMSAASEQ